MEDKELDWKILTDRGYILIAATTEEKARDLAEEDGYIVCARTSCPSCGHYGCWLSCSG